MHLHCHKQAYEDVMEKKTEYFLLVTHNVLNCAVEMEWHIEVMN